MFRSVQIFYWTFAKDTIILNKLTIYEYIWYKYIHLLFNTDIHSMHSALLNQTNTIHN